MTALQRAFLLGKWPATVAEGDLSGAPWTFAETAGDDPLGADPSKITWPMTERQSTTPRWSPCIIERPLSRSLVPATPVPKLLAA